MILSMFVSLNRDIHVARLAQSMGFSSQMFAKKQQMRTINGRCSFYRTQVVQIKISLIYH